MDDTPPPAETPAGNRAQRRALDQAPPPPRALHPRAGLRPGAWYACDFPERPPAVGVTAFDPQCGACSLALEAYARVTGRDAHIEQRTAGGVELPAKVTTSNRLRQVQRPRG